MVRVVCMSVLVVQMACGGPVSIFPGGRLSGREARADRWTEVVSGSGTLDLETRPADPYSVRIGFRLRNGNVYIDPTEERGWYQNLKAEPAVRVRFGDRIYRARAVLVVDPIELEGFEPDRRVYRLELVN